jgi:quercetin dioxygenase-like cupin family protein
MERRTLLNSTMAAAFAALLPNLANAQSSTVSPVFTQELPKLMMDNWVATASEVKYEPGAASKPHRHGGLVLGYVLEGDVRFRVEGGQETVYHTGQMFYEAPGAIHAVSANASATKPARLLAIILAEKGKPLTTVL